MGIGGMLGGLFGGNARKQAERKAAAALDENRGEIENCLSIASGLTHPYIEEWRRLRQLGIVLDKPKSDINTMTALPRIFENGSRR
jgi:hypothetical protein